MKFKLDFNFPSLSSNIKHDDGVVLLGSCFSDSMTYHFQSSGFKALSNPFGTLFHPIAIANTIKASLTNSTEVNVLERGGIFFSWDSGSKIYAYSKEDLKSKVIAARTELKNHLEEAKLLVITFGTSWGYRNSELNQIVGNCHKQPSELFEKELSSFDEMSKAWTEVVNEIRAVNYLIEIVYTVSPVRHKKDGLVENNRSKARLIELSHSVIGHNASYFPSYEILIDELRDYRFYTKDFVHPSGEAVEYIWKKLKDYLFNDEIQELIAEIEKVKSLMNHRSLYPNSAADQARIQKAKGQQLLLSSKHPSIYWE
ncbi:MAG: hypothetical protein ACJA0U_002831 [Salibacteraceae bacterium]|jgi:hypothetical protein